MRNPVEIENIEEMRRREGIDDVELRSEIRDLQVGDSVRLTLMTGTFLKQIGSTDHGVGTSALGFGGRFVYNALPHLDLESDLIIWPNNQASAGTWIQGLFGTKVGQRFAHVGLFAKVRPGFMHFRKDPFGEAGSGGSLLLGRNIAHTTDPIVDVGAPLRPRRYDHQLWKAQRVCFAFSTSR